MKIMKRFGLLLVMAILALSVSMTSCKKNESDKADKRITEAVSKLKLPQMLNSVTTLTECYYGEKMLTYRLETTSDTLASMNVDARRAVTLENLRTGLLPQNLIANLVKAGASVRYIYVCGKDSVLFTFSPEELK